MSRLDAIIEPRVVGRGHSLREGYRPRSSEALARMLLQHPCRACGATSAALLGNHGVGDPKPRELSSLLYCSLDHSCQCGFSAPVFVIFNDLLHEDAYPCVPAEQALAMVEGSLPPEQLEHGLVETRRLLHRGDAAEAVMLAERLVRQYPTRAECWFNAGCARQRLGDATAALDHYRRALALHPQLSAAWQNCALVLRQLGRLEDARICLLRQRQSGDQTAPSPSTPRLVHEVDGLFGRLRVIEDDDLRALYIDDQCQGVVYRHADDDGLRPGPMSHSAFATGWMLAGCQYPEGQGLMLGLGSGAGAVALLHNFPKMRLQVVELDAQLVDVVLEYFPRLGRLRRQGRLEIIHGDAKQLGHRPSSHGGPPYDFVLIDVFTGLPEPPALLGDPQVLAGLCAQAPLVLSNAIFTLGEQSQRTWLSLFEQAGHPIASVLPTGAPEQWSTRPLNWILSTAPVEGVPSFVPFEGSTSFIAETIQNDFRVMCERALRVPPLPAAATTECVAPAPEQASTVGHCSDATSAA